MASALACKSFAGASLRSAVPTSGQVSRPSLTVLGAAQSDGCIAGSASCWYKAVPCIVCIGRLGAQTHILMRGWEITLIASLRM